MQLFLRWYFSAFQKYPGPFGSVSIFLTITMVSIAMVSFGAHTARYSEGQLLTIEKHLDSFRIDLANVDSEGNLQTQGVALPEHTLSVSLVSLPDLEGATSAMTDELIDLDESINEQLSASEKLLSSIQALNQEDVTNTTDQSQLINQAAALIQRQVWDAWYLPVSSGNARKAKVLINLSDLGEILSLEIQRSSGNPSVDLSIEQAVYSAAPFQAIERLPNSDLRSSFEWLAIEFDPHSKK